METKRNHSRRNFLKMSAASAVAGGLAVSKSSAAKKALAAKAAWEDGMQINPDIDNTRVVFCHDPSMENGYPSDWGSIEDNDKKVDNPKIMENLDKLAMALAEKGSPEQAWSTIFQQPAGKEWSEVKAAIKVNGREEKCAPHLSVVIKVCEEL